MVRAGGRGRDRSGAGHPCMYILSWFVVAYVVFVFVFVLRYGW